MLAARCVECGRADTGTKYGTVECGWQYRKDLREPVELHVLHFAEMRNPAAVKRD